MALSAKAVGPKSSRLQAKVEKKRVRHKSFTLDLRVHSPFSEGYFGVDGIDPAPALLSVAKVKGIDMIAVTDFYSGSFIDSIMIAAQGASVRVIPGVDLRCTIPGCNDVVITALLPEHCSSADVEQLLHRLAVPKHAQGSESYVLEKPFEEILKAIDQIDGVVIPSRMDQTPYRFEGIRTLVDQYGFRAFDLAFAESQSFFEENWPDVEFQLFSFSKANSLAQVGSRTAEVKLPECGFAGIRELVARDAL